MSLSTDIRRFRQKTKIRTDIIVRKIAFDVLLGVIKRSPVDTGRFRASWRVGVGIPDTSVESPREEPSEKRRLDSADAGELGAGLASLEGVEAGSIVFITNALPYAQRLEGGYSQQAPPDGIVGDTIDEVVSKLDSVLEQL